MLKKCFSSLTSRYAQVKSTLTNQKGAISLEWLAIGLLCIVLVSMIITFISAEGNPIGEAVGGKLVELIEMIGGGGEEG